MKSIINAPIRPDGGSQTVQGIQKVPKIKARLDNGLTRLADTEATLEANKTSMAYI